MSSAGSDKTDESEGGKALADSGHEGTADFREFILTRELSEVFLLLDNLAADADTTIAALSKQKPPDGLKGDWIEQICQIKWPSTASRASQAEQAALVIKAKDYLNGLAKPASGSSIAFTLLFTQRPEETASKRKSKRNAESDPPLKDCRTARRAMAAEAYPEYEEAAGRFRRFHRSICIILLVWLVFTCLLSWYVAYGNAALGEVATFKTNLEKAQTRVDDDEAGHRTAAPSATGADTLTPSQVPESMTRERRSADTSVVKTDPQVGYCERSKLIPPPKPPDGLVRYENPEQRQACRDLATAQADLRHGEYRLYKWLGWWRPVLTVSPPWRDSEDASSVASRLTSVLGTAVLPVLYGFLGAGAAVLRSISRRIKFSTLTPRDLHLSLLQLALGAVVGACIGLFIVQPGENSPLIGPVTLSGSAISFVAGFGVDAVFQALEGLISRIFNVAAVGATAQPSDGKSR
jgi:hypothetical protein